MLYKSSLFSNSRPQRLENRVEYCLGWGILLSKYFFKTGKAKTLGTQERGVWTGRREDGEKRKAGLGRSQHVSCGHCISSFYNRAGEIHEIAPNCVGGLITN